MLPGDLANAGRFRCCVPVNDMQEALKASSQKAAFFTHSQKSSSFAADVFLPFFVSPLSAYTAVLHSHWFSMNGELEERGKEGKGKRKEKGKEITEEEICNFLQFPTGTNSSVIFFMALGTLAFEQSPSS